MNLNSIFTSNGDGRKKKRKNDLKGREEKGDVTFLGLNYRIPFYLSGYEEKKRGPGIRDKREGKPF